MQDLLARAEKVGAILKARRETVAVAESSSGGLISASLLSVPGASAYFLGGAVCYTRVAMREMLKVSQESFAGMRGLTEPVALVIARAARDRLLSTWSLSEIGAGDDQRDRFRQPAHPCE